jgi:predicted Zn-dependent peptidase
MEPHVQVFENGLTALFDPVPFVESCAIALWFPVGSRNEPATCRGVAHLVEHMIFRGSKRYSAVVLQNKFDALGAYTNAYTTKEETCYYARCLAADSAQVLALLLHSVLYPELRADHVRREQKIIVEEILSYEDDAEEVIADLAEAALFGSHPLGNPIAGTVQQVLQLKRQDVVMFHQRHYIPQQCIVTISGNFDQSAVAAILELLPKPKQRKPPKPKPPTKTFSGSIMVQKPYQQSHVLLYKEIPGETTPFRNAMGIVNTVLGDGTNSRLNRRIRERNALAYSVYSQLQFLQGTGIWLMGASYDTDNHGRVTAMIRDEFETFVRDGFRKGEFSRAKQQLVVSKVLSLESLSARCTHMAKSFMERGFVEPPDQTAETIRSVTMADCAHVVQFLGSWESWSSVVSHPITQ